MEKKFDLSSLFTTTNEKSGVWYEAKINGKETGLEFLILGPSSDENVLSAEAYKKAKDKIDAEKDPVKKSQMDIDAVCDRISAVVKEVRTTNGEPLYIGDKKVESSPELIKKILYENIDIRTDVFTASFESANFRTKKL